MELKSEENIQLTMTQIEGLKSAPSPEKPIQMDMAIKEEVIKAAMMMFPGFGRLAGAINVAKKEGYNIIIPLIFMADGRVLIQEPIVQEAVKVEPKEGDVVPDAGVKASG